MLSTRNLYKANYHGTQFKRKGRVLERHKTVKPEVRRLLEDKPSSGERWSGGAVSQRGFEKKAGRSNSSTVSLVSEADTGNNLCNYYSFYYNQPEMCILSLWSGDLLSFYHQSWLLSGRVIFRTYSFRYFDRYRMEHNVRLSGNEMRRLVLEEKWCHSRSSTWILGSWQIME